MSSIARPVARSVSRSVLAGQGVDLGYLIRSMFSSGEQGFFYDPNDLSTMYQDAAGTVPVTAAGQPVGLMLDKSKGLALSAELLTALSPLNSTLSSTLPPLTATSTAASGVYGASKANFAQAGKTYKVKMSWSGNTQLTNIVLQCGGVGTPALSLPSTLSGTIEAIFIVSNIGPLNIYKTSTAIGQSFTIDSISIKEVAGNHAYQTQSAMRPLLVASPQRLDYDTADDKLITTLPAQLTGCTVIRSVPNVGTQILTGQTIPTTYNDNTDHCGLLVINRALTATETSQITKLFNRAAGV